jgi:succinate dehydrogenase hydrophobic anchor subunit
MLGANQVEDYQQTKMKKSLLISIPILFLVSGLLHFVYEFTGRLAVIGAFAPVNESPWEHLKLVFYPVLIWWLIFYFRGRKKEGWAKEKWLLAAATAVFAAPLTILIFFYFYTGAFGTEILALDISSTLLAIAVGQGLAYHLYKYAKPSKLVSFFSLAVIIILIAMFVIFTFQTPHVPLFRDRNTGSYGIGL